MLTLLQALLGFALFLVIVTGLITTSLIFIVISSDIIKKLRGRDDAIFL